MLEKNGKNIKRMPELPEVHTISQDLNKHIVGFKIKNIQISRNYKLPIPEITKLKILISKKITNVDKIAKNIVVEVSNNTFLMFHLAMTGRILLRDRKDKQDNWVKIVFELEKGNQLKQLRFCDMRQFGKIRVVNEKELKDFSKKYGLNPLSEDNTPEKLLKALKSKKTNIKNALLDQNLIFGLGNIYATDALFLSNINPKISTQDINLEDTKKLSKSIKQILKEGIKNRGSTLPDKMYVDIFGQSGNQQNHFKIYGKKICSVCNSNVSFEKLNGRGTYFCPTCQPINILNLDKNNEKNNLKNTKTQKKLF